ncbi:hypothetical protein BZA77DRAFT_303549 [Pyronema omphalodes]|nr:hypothetical protein BZA77DRAFT_303549 [Pyronema omphalodes]
MIFWKHIYIAICLVFFLKFSSYMKTTVSYLATVLQCYRFFLILIYLELMISLMFIEYHKSWKNIFNVDGSRKSLLYKGLWIDVYNK